MRHTLARWFTPAPDSMAADSVRREKSPWVDSVHLLWSVWVFLVPIFDRYSLRWLVLTLVSYPLFLMLYALSHVLPRRRTPWAATGMLLLAYGLLPWYPSALTYFVFGCIMLCSCRVALPRYLAMVLALNALMIVEAHWLAGYSWVSLISIPIMTVVIGFVVIAERTSEQQRIELKLSHDEVRRLAATAERERIGRDLHDLLGHTLSLITLKLELSRKLHERGDSTASRREADEAERVARHTLAEVRAAVSGIRSTDLAAELASAKLLLEASGVHTDYLPPPANLPPEIERTLSLVLREAATNIARHAGASRARIAFEQAEQVLLLTIGDDGRGGIGADGNGLCGMRERVRAIGGSLTVDSPRGQGSRLRVTVNLPRLRVVESSEQARRPPHSERAA